MLNTERTPITGKRVQLMATCLCDAFYDDVAAATVEVLRSIATDPLVILAEPVAQPPNRRFTLIVRAA